ncbi:hypothetical protein HD554DRAFT_2170210 [Boletus coccyginus]|nr:hypothetical protein HD554DRAFT_2170210 [Boletus coccyginus]
MSALTLSQNMEDVRLLRAITYSGYTLLVWGYLLTLDDESVLGGEVLVYRKSLRESPRAGSLHLRSSWDYSIAFKRSLSWILLGGGPLPNLVLRLFLMLLRVWILYGRTLKITIALIAAFILYISANIGVLAYILRAINFPNSASEGMCVEELPPFSWMIWVFELLLEACLFGLTIFTLRRQKSTSEFARVSRLVRSLYSHAIIFFLANTFSNILNVVTWSVLAGTPLYDVADKLTITFVNITGQWLAIDLRRLYIQKDVTQSEISRVVAFQLAAFDNSDPALPMNSAEIPEIQKSRVSGAFSQSVGVQRHSVPHLACGEGETFYQEHSTV